MVGIGAVQYSLKSPVSESALATMRYDTPVGGQRLIALADGSQIELNTKTVVRTAVSKTLRSEEHTSELQSLLRISYAVFCLKKNKTKHSDTSLQLTNHTTDTILAHKNTS